MNYLTLQDIDAYVRSFKLSNYVWGIVIQWESFSKFSIGQQFTQATDSISANIAEGFGRYTKKDKIRFYRISMGSLKECIDWNEKAKVRKLLTNEQYEFIAKELEILPVELNQLIKYTNKVLKY